MAWIVNATKTPPTAAATSFTPLLGAHVANDLLLVFLAQDGGATAISTATSGWTILADLRGSTGVRHAVAYKVAALFRLKD